MKPPDYLFGLTNQNHSKNKIWQNYGKNIIFLAIILPYLQFITES